MQEVKWIFHDKYQQCEIDPRPEYKLGTIEKPTVYGVDCIFDAAARIGGRHCDEFIFFGLNPSSTGIYLVERKDSYSNNIKKVKQQLQGGADFIEKFLESDPATDQGAFDFIPVWVSRGIKPSIRSRLVKIRISLRNIQKPIKHVNTKGTLPKMSKKPISP